MTAARVGEQMKCKVAGRESGVSVRSQGVIRILGVRYWKLESDVYEAARSQCVAQLGRTLCDHQYTY